MLAVCALCVALTAIQVIRRRLPEWLGGRLVFRLPQDYHGLVEVTTNLDPVTELEEAESIVLEVPPDGRVTLNKKTKLFAYHRITGVYPDGTVFPGSYAGVEERTHPLFVYFVMVEDSTGAPRRGKREAVWYFIGSSEEFSLMMEVIGVDGGERRHLVPGRIPRR